MKYYKHFEGKTEEEANQFSLEFERLKTIALEQQTGHNLRISDFSE